jgi:hypothetical protein
LSLGSTNMNLLQDIIRIEILCHCIDMTVAEYVSVGRYIHLRVIVHLTEKESIENY